MTFTTDQLLLVAGIVLIVYPLVAGRGVDVGAFKLPTLPLLSQVALAFFGVIVIAMSISAQLFRAEETFENPTISDQRLDICLYSHGNACGYEAATVWCRQKQFKLASIWTVDPDVGHTRLLGTLADCGADNCSAFRTITCLR